MSREILLLVDALAREKNVTRDVVFDALEGALASAMKKRFKEDADIRVSVDRTTGGHDGFRRWLVVPDDAGLQEPDQQEMLSDAQEIVSDIEVGEYIEEALEPLEFGRIGAQAAKQAILQRVHSQTEDSYGLIIFSHAAWYHIPPTQDTATFARYLSGLTTDFLPGGGSALVT